MAEASVDIRPEAGPREHSPVSDAALWTSVLGGPLVFLLNLEVAYVMTDWTCNTGNGWALHVVHLVSLALAAAMGLLGLRLWRRVGDETPGSAGGAAARSRLLAAVGVLGGALFAVCVLAQWLPVVVLGPCPRS